MVLHRLLLAALVSALDWGKGQVFARRAGSPAPR